jgi:hypothetical protein
VRRFRVTVKFFDDQVLEAEVRHLLFVSINKPLQYQMGFLIEMDESFLNSLVLIPTRL